MRGRGEDLEGGAYFCIKKAVCEIGSKNQLFFMLLIQLRVRDDELSDLAFF